MDIMLEQARKGGYFFTLHIPILLFMKLIPNDGSNLQLRLQRFLKEDSKKTSKFQTRARIVPAEQVEGLSLPTLEVFLEGAKANILSWTRCWHTQTDAKKRPLDHGIFLEGAKAIFCHATDTDALKRMQMLVTHACSRQRDTEALKRMQMLVTHWHGRILFALPKAENPFSGRALGKRCRRSTKYNSSEALKLSDHVEQQLWHQ